MPCGCANTINGVELVDDRVIVDMSLTDAVLSPITGTAGLLGSNYITSEISKRMVSNGGQALNPNVSGIAKISLGALTSFLGFRYAGDFAVPVIVGGLGMGIAGTLDIARQNLPENTKQLVGLAGINAVMLNRPVVTRSSNAQMEELILEAA